MTLAHVFIHVLCFKEFPLAVSAFQQDSAFKYYLLPLPVSVEENNCCHNLKYFIADVLINLFTSQDNSVSVL